MRKKILVNILVTICMVHGSRAQSFNVNWVNGTHGSNSVRAEHIKTDNSGNIYVTGRFQGTIDIDPGSLTDNITSKGVNDIFLQKFDPQGNLLWAKQLGGSGQDYVYDLEVSSSGVVYFTGQFVGIFDPNPNTPLGGFSFSYVSAGGADAFLVSLNADGSFNWSKRVGGSGNDVGRAINLGPNDLQINWSGTFSNIVDMDPSIAGTEHHTSNGSTDVFLTTLQASGAFVQSVTFGGSSTVRLYDMVTDTNNGDIFLTGYFSGTVDFNPGAGISTATAIGNRGLYVVHLGTTGNYKKRFTLNNSDNIYPHTISLDDSNNVYVGGRFNRPVVFGGMNYSPTLNTYDGMVVKLRSANWSFQQKSFAHYRSVTDFSVNSVDATIPGKVLVGGQFNTTANFDFSVSNSQTISNGRTDFFVQKLANDLSYISAPHIGGGSGSDIITDLTVNAGKVVVCGYFEDNVAFHPSVSLNSAGLTDAFVLKFDKAPLSVNSLSERNEQFELYPNPTQGLLNIKFVNPIKDITVYSITGQVLKSQTAHENETTLDISDLPPANYFVSINGQLAEIITKK